MMERSLMENHGGVQGYSRAAVDDFLAAAQEERAQLHRTISEASQRIARANQASGLHRVMLTMLLDTGREIARIREDAESRAASIVVDAQGAASAAATPAAGPYAELIDLRNVERSEAALSVVPEKAGTGADMDSDTYFRYLNGALADEEPLGPRPE